MAQLANLAEQIVRVRVVDVQGQWDRSADGRAVIHTYVTCQVVKTLKGAPVDKIRLRFLGGRVGDTRMEIPEMPLFTPGEQSVLFIAGNGMAFCPLVGAKYGRYRVMRDASGVERVAPPDGGIAARADDFEMAIASRLAVKR